MVNFTVPPARLLLAFWTVTSSVTASPVSTRFVGAWRLVTVGSFCVRGVIVTVCGAEVLAVKSSFGGHELWPRSGSGPTSFSLFVEM